MAGRIENGVVVITVGEVTMALETLERLKAVARQISQDDLRMLYEFDADLFAKINTIKAIVSVDDAYLISRSQRG